MLQHVGSSDTEPFSIAEHESTKHMTQHLKCQYDVQRAVDTSLCTMPLRDPLCLYCCDSLGGLGTVLLAGGCLSVERHKCLLPVIKMYCYLNKYKHKSYITR
jgi:hypothetical protein